MKKECHDTAVVKISEKRIIPLTAFENVDDGLKFCEILFKNGIKVLEITFRTKSAAETIRKAAKEFPDMLIGAGTVLNKTDLEMAFESGAKFAVSPGVNPQIVMHAAEIGLPFYPGIANPTDIELAYSLGVRIMKFFPAEALGGVKLLNAMSAPYKHLGIKYLPTGGINPAIMPSYLAIEDVLAVGGTWLADKKLIAAGKWNEIEKLVKDALNIIEPKG